MDLAWECGGLAHLPRIQILESIPLRNTQKPTCRRPHTIGIPL